MAIVLTLEATTDTESFTNLDFLLLAKTFFPAVAFLAVSFVSDAKLDMLCAAGSGSNDDDDRRFICSRCCGACTRCCLCQVVTSGGIILRIVHVKIKKAVTTAMVDAVKVDVIFSLARILASCCLRRSMLMDSIKPPPDDSTTAEDSELPGLGLSTSSSTKRQSGIDSSSASMTFWRSTRRPLLEERVTTIFAFTASMLGSYRWRYMGD